MTITDQGDGTARISVVKKDGTEALLTPHVELYREQVKDPTATPTDASHTDESSTDSTHTE